MRVFILCDSFFLGFVVEEEVIVGLMGIRFRFMVLRKLLEN